MQLTHFLAFAGLAAIAPSGVLGAEAADSNGYYQEPSGSASFTQYSGCGTPG